MPVSTEQTTVVTLAPCDVHDDIACDLSAPSTGAALGNANAQLGTVDMHAGQGALPPRLEPHASENVAQDLRAEDSPPLPQAADGRSSEEVAQRNTSHTEDPEEPPFVSSNTWIPRRLSRTSRRRRRRSLVSSDSGSASFTRQLADVLVAPVVGVGASITPTLEPTSSKSAGAPAMTSDVSTKSESSPTSADTPPVVANPKTQQEFRKSLLLKSNRIVHTTDGAVFRMQAMVMNGDCGFAAVANGINLHAARVAPDAYAKDLTPEEMEAAHAAAALTRLLLNGPPVAATTDGDGTDQRRNANSVSSDSTVSSTTSGASGSKPVAPPPRPTDAADGGTTSRRQISRLSATVLSVFRGAASAGMQMTPPSSRDSNVTKGGKTKSELDARDIRHVVAKEVQDNMSYYRDMSQGVFTEAQLTSFVKSVTRPGMTGHWLGTELGAVEFVAVARALDISLAIYCFDVPTQTVRRFEHAKADTPRFEICLCFTGPATSGHFDLLWKPPRRSSGDNASDGNSSEEATNPQEFSTADSTA